MSRSSAMHPQRAIKRVDVPMVPDLMNSNRPSFSTFQQLQQHHHQQQPHQNQNGSRSMLLPRAKSASSNYDPLSAPHSPATHRTVSYHSTNNGDDVDHHYPAIILPQKQINGALANPQQQYTPQQMNGHSQPIANRLIPPPKVPPYLVNGGQATRKLDGTTVDTDANNTNNNNINNNNNYGSVNRCQQPPPKPVMTLNAGTPKHRNSTGSNSSQGSSSGFESMKSSTPASVTTPTQHTLRGDSPPSRNSVHSSSSGGSLGSGSLERLDERSCSSNASTVDGRINVATLIMNGAADAEVLAAWLHDLRLDDYLELFLNQGYDVSTVARMTPEDLTAIGITKPGHRKRLTAEIHRWHVADNWPASPPLGGLREWLRAVGMPEYISLFESQGYGELREVMKLTWEDFEDVGITRLGHLKKLGLAIKKLKDARLGSPDSVSASLAPTSYGQMTVMNILNNARNTAEVKPYCHQPTTTNGMNTFYNGPDAMTNHLIALPSTCNGLPTNATEPYGTFPRRAAGRTMITTEAVVHDGRPTVEVRPTVASTKVTSSSQEYLHQHSNGWLNNGSGGDDDIDETKAKNRTNARFLQQPEFHNDSNPNDSSRPFRLHLHSPGRILSDAKPPLAPKIGRQSSAPPPPAPSNVKQRSNETVDSSDSEQQYPPPPAPIACEGPIRRLRSVISVTTDGIPCTSSSNNGQGGNIDSNTNSSRSSTSSTETLPFANENCGTIKSRHGVDQQPSQQPQSSGYLARSSSAGNAMVGSSSKSQPVTPRRSARDIFDDQAALERRIQQCMDNGSAEGLDDIGSMLQNLTDELDALLCPAASTGTVSQNVQPNRTS